MKKLCELKYAVAIVATFLISACTETPFLSNDEFTEMIENPDYEVIRSMGYHTEGIVEKEDLYVVEGDMLIYKSHIDSLRHTPATRQARYNNIITGGKEDGIRVKISSNNVPDSEWRQAVYDAIDIWNAVPNCPVYLSKITQQLFTHDVKVQMSNEYEVSAASIPNSGDPGKNIYINPNIGDHNETHEQKVYILVHEFGHILGLAHTNYISNYASGETKDNPENISYISGTPETEFESVMYSHAAGRSAGDASNWTGFTTGDLAAIQSLYGTPIWSSEIIGPNTSWTTSQPTYTVNVGTNLTNLTVSWYVNNSLIQSGSLLNFTPISLPLGQVTLKVVVSKGGHSRESTKIITVTTQGAQPLFTPEISALYSSINAGQSVTVMVINTPASAQGSYEWNITGGYSPVTTTTSTNSITFVPTSSFGIGLLNINSNPGDWTVMVKCRRISGTQYSEWSTPVSILVTSGGNTTPGWEID
ncbi:MAG: M57 family metalloprotease [Rikenellaceae bacterium]|nr:M57 family metalloprotease [Rikenellaceae bacterium]